ncbi:type II secretion system protein [Nocardioides nitrophenolicus]|uniref:type II secretion system protein n=1 Tax=Nocardioides nitrophenolicus TaxID=60489 RepID=UPI00195C18F3|nr:type II secretion system protein [Nocardioides nitrophenolicus]MBM7515624.1 type II secretory pathway pseudopilin PulG [Nocardioides nitrophenolicus]
MKRGDADRGESLVEVLAAVVILGIAGVAIMTGLMLAVKTSDIHRKETTSGAYVKSYAEAIQNYVETHQSAFTCSPDYRPGVVGFPVPNGYTTSFTVSAVDPAGGAAACTANTAQLVILTVSSGDDRAVEKLAFVLRRPCSGAQDPSAVSRCA